MTIARLAPLALLLAPVAATAQEAYKIEPLKEGPPAALAPAVKGALMAEGFRILDPEGKPFAEVWLRKGVPASSKPTGAKGPILYPILTEGELLGALRFVAEGHDYRDQAIPAGVYTLRYGLQPVNGDHLGVSPFRDYALLSPAAKDKEVADIPQKNLEKQSADAAGSNHPAVMLLQVPPPGTRQGASMVRDEAKNTWGAILPLPLSVKGEAAAVPLAVQLVVVGAAA